MSEFETFFWVILAGATVGLVFDLYRSFRRWQDFGQILTFIGDVIFSLISIVILFYFFERANALDFRFYIIWGSLLGLGLYLKIFSVFTLRACFGFYRLISYLAKLIHRSIKIPIRGLVIIMRPPYAILHWLSLLLYRIGEVILLKRARRVKRRLRNWWKGLLPPRTNG
ncbi:spore cortex biosynthesis protein YabQ [Desulfosporosinus lacus]|uniref:spore cortex biosynthesis protein YabQ n=1 Tax=Desulfosporosinus lacus TaxID=329936 RepID=UPI000932F702